MFYSNRANVLIPFYFTASLGRFNLVPSKTKKVFYHFLMLNKNRIFARNKI